LVTDGLCWHIPSGTQITPPIYSLHITLGHDEAESDHHWRVNTLQHHVIADPGSQATLFEIHQSLSTADTSDPYFTNVQVKLRVGAGATLHRYKLQADGDTALHLAHTTIDLDEKACVENHSYHLNTGVCREEIHARLQGDESRCDLNGLSLLRDKEQLDSHLLVEHFGQRSHSRQYYKNLVADSATGSFTGKVIVRPNAIKTLAEQTNKNLLVNQTATANTQPALETYTDDVQCNHGATVGQIEEDKLFYLCSRGLPKAVARMLLMQGFLNDILKTIALPPVKHRVDKLLSYSLSQLSSLESKEGDRA